MQSKLSVHEIVIKLQKEKKKRGHGIPNKFGENSVYTRSTI